MIKKAIIVIALLLFAGNSIAATIVASRTTGVAPLYVHFSDSDGCVDSDGSAPEPFHDYSYEWNFGDTGSGTWGTSGDSKNIDFGPVAAHVYETAGSFTVTLTVKNLSTGATISSDTESITVTDPDTVFAGTLTTCVSTTSDFTGCPSGAAQVTTSSLAGISGYTDAGERVLLRRGSSWTVGSAIGFPANAGPVHIGAFGTCSSPDSSGRCSNAPVVDFTPSSGSFFDVYHKLDWRMADISFTGVAGAEVVSGAQGGKNLLFLRLAATGFNAGISNYIYVDEWDTDHPELFGIVSCYIHDVYDNGMFVGSERMGIMGNTIAKNEYDQHVLRIWQGYRAVISHNILSGAVPGRHVMKLMGPAPAGEEGNFFVSTSGSGAVLRQYTKQAVVRKNIFGGDAPWSLVSIGPQNDVYDERLSDILFENNIVLRDYGVKQTLNPDNQFEDVDFSCRYVTVRNNIIDGTRDNIPHSGRSLHVWQRGVEPTPTGFRIYNNTIINRNTSLVTGEGIQIGTGSTNIIIRNNIISFPNFAETGIDDLTGAATISNNLITDNAYFADPNNSTPLSRDFSLTASSTAAIDQGYAVPVLYDYDGNSRVGVGAALDVGAYEYDSGGEPTPTPTPTPTQAPITFSGSCSGRLQ